MPFIEGLASQAVGAGMGMLLGNYNDRRQREQQKDLQRIQIQGQKEMTDYQYEKQLQMWRDTNYKAQVEELNRAGMNPALLYGMSGGGATTTGSGSGSVQGGSAPQGGGEAIAGAGMGLQMAMMQAQKDLIEAQTKKTNVEAEKTAGVDTTKTATEIESLSQGIENAKVQAELGKVQTRLAKLDETIVQGTVTERIDRIVWESLRVLEDLEMVSRNNYINKATQNAQIDIVRRTAIGALLKNILTGAQTAKTEQETLNIEAERKNIQNKISMWAQENYIQLMNMSTEQRRTAIGEQLKDSKLEMQGVSELIDGISEILEGTMKNRTGPTRNPVGFK